MTDTTQPPAETLAEAQEIAIHFALPGMYDGISTHATRRGDADDKPYMRAILAALTRRAGGDAIPAGKRDGWRKNLAGVKSGSDCYRTIDGVRWFWEPTPPALLKGTGIRHRAAPEGNSFVHPDDIDKLDAHLNGATPKPPAGGDAGAVEDAVVIRRNGAFFRPNAQGYTTHIFAAGIYSRKEADAYADVEGVTIHPLAEYRAEAERTIEGAQRILAALALPAPVEEGERKLLDEAIEHIGLLVSVDPGPKADAVFAAARAWFARQDAALSEGRSHG